MREARCRHAGRAAARRAGRRGVRWRQAGPHGAPLTRRAAGPDAAHAAINVSRWLAAQREQCTRRQDQRGRGGAEERRCREQHWRPASQLPSPISRWPSTLSAADATARARPARHSRCSRPPPDALASTVAPSAGKSRRCADGAQWPTANICSTLSGAPLRIATSSGRRRSRARICEGLSHMVGANSCGSSHRIRNEPPCLAVTLAGARALLVEGLHHALAAGEDLKQLDGAAIAPADVREPPLQHAPAQ